MTGFRDGMGIGVGVALLAIAGFVLAYRFVDPSPPATVVFSGGEAGGAYSEFGGRYAAHFAVEDVTLEVHPSAGSIENLERLLAGEADVALVQGGTVGSEREGLISLGSVFLEPLWVFHRADIAPTRLSELRGLRIAIGSVGSGTRAVALSLLGANDAAGPPTELIESGSAAAADALRAGDVDAAFFVASPESQVVAELLQAGGLALMSFDRAAAWARTHRFFSQILLPEGAIDFARNLPPHDVVLLGAAANLVVREDFHPVLIDLLLQGADAIHSGASLFADPDEFPSPRFAELPLSRDAQRYYEVGPPFLQRYLPFWAATQIDRLKVMLLPLVALLLPLVRAFPPLYRWRVRSRIYRWYKELDQVDPESDAPGGVVGRFAELDRIEDEVRKVETPASYAEELYHLRLHLELVRRKLDAVDSARLQG